MKKSIKIALDTYWDNSKECIIYQNDIVYLPQSMQNCLKLLIAYRGQPLQNTQIYLEVWPEKNDKHVAKSVRTLISSIRKKIPSLKISNHYGGYYSLEKFREETPNLEEYLLDILDQTKVGITITDPNKEDNPVIYVNQTYADTFGYEPEEVIGKNLRYLQAKDRDQEERVLIREAIKNKTEITTIIRNYHKSGRLIYNELTLSPIFDKKTLKLKYFIGIQKDITYLYQYFLKSKESRNADEEE